MNHRNRLAPRVVAWESTVACNLACVHCRASAQTEPAPGELDTGEVKALIDDIASFATPVFIISGGEPLMRPDIFEIARYASESGLHVAMSPNGTLISGEAAREMASSGVRRVSVSIDGSSASRHDQIRGVPGAFAAALDGIAACRASGLAYQFNTTVMRQNLDDLTQLHEWVIDQRATAWHVFMLVPTGRGQEGDEIKPEEYERVLEWLYSLARTSVVPIRVTCGPQFMRIVTSNRREDGELAGLDRPTHPHRAGHPSRPSRGCLAADGYCFVSHKGDVFPCGYLPLSGGNVRETPFHEIYQRSELFETLRDLSSLRDRCGVCEYTKVCGGCRARAYGMTGDHLAEDPLCTYQPRVREAQVDAT